MKTKERGRALIVGGHDKIIQTFLKNTRPHGGVVNRAVTIVVADALVQRHSEQELNHVQFRTCTWPELC